MTSLDGNLLSYLILSFFGELGVLGLLGFESRDSRLSPVCMR